jgi:hypothetical protein
MNGQTYLKIKRVVVISMSKKCLYKVKKKLTINLSIDLYLQILQNF